MKNKGKQAQAEAVIPLDRLERWINDLANRPVSLVIDGREFARTTADEMQRAIGDLSRRRAIFAY